MCLGAGSQAPGVPWDPAGMAPFGMCCSRPSAENQKSKHAWSYPVAGRVQARRAHSRRRHQLPLGERHLFCLGCQSSFVLDVVNRSSSVTMVMYRSAGWSKASTDVSKCAHCDAFRFSVPSRTACGPNNKVVLGGAGTKERGKRAFGR